MSRQVHHHRRAPDPHEFSSLGQHDGAQRLLSSGNLHLYLSTARRVESPAHQFYLSAHAHVGHKGQKDVLQVGHRRSPGHVCAAPQRQARFPTGQRQGQKYCLEHQAYGAGATALGRLGHVKDVLAGTRRAARGKGDRLGAQLGAFQVCPTHSGSRSHTGEVLGPQARLSAPGADVFNAHRPPGEDRQRQRSAQNLPPSFAIRAVNHHHILQFVIRHSFTFPSHAMLRKPDARWSRATLAQ